jgi:tetratricopeptide (TPR) repeat protein
MPPTVLGVLRGEQERLEEAERLFKRALDLDPKLLGAAINLGYLYRKLDRPDEALAAFLCAEKIQPGDTEVQLNIASLRPIPGISRRLCPSSKRSPGKASPKKGR